jgi:hypothetical protein
VGDQAWQAWFEDAWAVREQGLYRAHFGNLGLGIFPLDAEMFTTQFHQKSIDPRWLTEGVFECPPSGTRTSWLYVSSGLSNAWEADSPNPDEASGLGCEFVLECPRQSIWALLLLRRMVAFQILLSVGRFPDKGLLEIWDRVPLRAPIDGLSSALNWVLLTPHPLFHGPQQLPSGRFQFVHFVGVTEDEAEYARKSGSEELVKLLTPRSVWPVTDPSRQTVLSQLEH